MCCKLQPNLESMNIWIARYDCVHLSKGVHLRNPLVREHQDSVAPKQAQKLHAHGIVGVVIKIQTPVCMVYDSATSNPNPKCAYTHIHKRTNTHPHPRLHAHACTQESTHSPTRTSSMHTRSTRSMHVHARTCAHPFEERNILDSLESMNQF